VHEKFALSGRACIDDASFLLRDCGSESAGLTDSSNKRCGSVAQYASHQRRTLFCAQLLVYTSPSPSPWLLTGRTTERLMGTLKQLPETRNWRAFGCVRTNLVRPLVEIRAQSTEMTVQTLRREIRKTQKCRQKEGRAARRVRNPLGSFTTKTARNCQELGPRQRIPGLRLLLERPGLRRLPKTRLAWPN
jgi:hypothetical protein